MKVMSATTISKQWTDECLSRANHRAWKFLALAVASFLVLVVLSAWFGSKWVFVLIPLCIELAVPGLRYFLGQPKMRRLMDAHPWRSVAVRFVPGRGRIGRQAYLEMSGSDRSYLRLAEMPEAVREYIRRTGLLWLAGPDERGRAVVITQDRPFVTLGRIVIR
jgi:hypothetical protein